MFLMVSKNRPRLDLYHKIKQKKDRFENKKKTKKIRRTLDLYQEHNF